MLFIRANESLVDDLSYERGIVPSRVALCDDLLRFSLSSNDLSGEALSGLSAFLIQLKWLETLFGSHQTADRFLAKSLTRNGSPAVSRLPTVFFAKSLTRNGIPAVSRLPTVFSTKSLTRNVARRLLATSRGHHRGDTSDRGLLVPQVNKTATLS